MTDGGLRDLKKETEDVSQQEKEIKNPKVNIVEKILEFNRQQQGQEPKILTPSQMLSKLAISLAWFNAGNNSEKLKNKIR